MLDNNVIEKCIDFLSTEYGIPKQTTKKKLIDLWLVMFKGENEKVLLNAVKSYIDVGTFFPKVSEIKEIITKSKMPYKNKEWADLIAVLPKVSRLYEIANAGYTFENQSDNARKDLIALFDGLSPIIKCFVGSVDFLVEISEMDATSLSVQRVRFEKDYSDLQKELQHHVIKGDVGHMIESNNNPGIKQIES